MFKENSVDEILSVFNKTIEKLNVLSVNKTKEAEKYQDEAQAAKRKADEASDEAKKARVAAEKITKAIGV